MNDSGTAAQIWHRKIGRLLDSLDLILSKAKPCILHDDGTVSLGRQALNAPKRIDRALLKDGAFAKHFWSRVGRSAGCWIWTGCVDKKGYGRVRVSLPRTILGAHRVAYALAHGTDPAPMLVLHECDNPACCNPKHLFLGDDATNAADKVSKGRARGRFSAPLKVAREI